jgi:molybdate transport system substrate-binding protein
VRRATVPLVVAVLALAGCAPQAAEPTPTADPLTGTVTVFAAASLTETFGEIAEQFEAAHPGVTVVLNFGGSSGLAQQIVEGAPADVFAAASGTTMEAVGDLAIDPAVFVTNTLEIAVPVGNPGAVAGLADFANANLAIALCAVEVPCGAASATVFDGAGIVPSVDTYEQDVKAVLTKVELGEVDAGLVYRTDVIAAADSVEGIEFAEASTAVGKYPIATLTDSEAAAAFVAFVLSEDGQQILADAGFGAP